MFTGPTDWIVMVAVAVAVLPAESVTVTVAVTAPGICSESSTDALFCWAPPGLNNQSALDAGASDQTSELLTDHV